MLKSSSNMRFITRVFFVATTLGVFLPSARAGLFDDEEARRDIARHRVATEAQFKEVDAKLAKLDEAIKSLGIIQIINQLDQVNGELAKLRGQNEVMVNQFEQMQKRQKDFYFDLDARIRALEGAPATAPAAGSVTAPVNVPAAVPGTPAITLVTPTAVPNIIIAPQSNPPNQGLVVTPVAGEVIAAPPISGRPIIAKSAEAQLATYDVGTNAFKANQFTNAVRGYEAFLQEFPQHILAPNAMYWIGISHFNLNEFVKARAIQERLLKLYPESSKAPDAMLAIAAVQQEMGDAGSARNTYQDIVARYPDSEAAVKARARLNTRLRNGK
jgi:tol-pal system protein YbgF